MWVRERLGAERVTGLHFDRPSEGKGKFPMMRRPSMTAGKDLLGKGGRFPGWRGKGPVEKRGLMTPASTWFGDEGSLSAMRWMSTPESDRH